MSDRFEPHREPERFVPVSGGIQDDATFSYLDTVTAIGMVSAELAARADAWNGNAPAWFPEPPEWLELWKNALSGLEASNPKAPDVGGGS